jgi:hypothetical protein
MKKMFRTVYLHFASSSLRLYGTFSKDFSEFLSLIGAGLVILSSKMIRPSNTTFEGSKYLLCQCLTFPFIHF